VESTALVWIILLRALLDSQIRWSYAAERRLPPQLTVDGYSDFAKHIVPAYLKPGAVVYDVGGGKRPYVTAKQKAAFGLTIVGIDIDQAELDRAPAGIYDRTICADVSQLRGSTDADLLICLAVLEHVRDVSAAFTAIASCLKPGGKALIFVPSRHAPFARLNLIVPEGLKRRVLYYTYPQSRGHQGFPSYYDRCTPRDFAHLAGESGLRVEDEKLYFVSTYFYALFPAYVLWRLSKQLIYLFDKRVAAETFAMVLSKPLAATQDRAHS
jgi:SAM-dependent methyltransferase